MQDNLETPFTPFPNALLDSLMPTLKDTEWRLLCVVVRQTRGWVDADGKERKVWDWLSQSQLKKRTGRNTGALSKALDVLVRRGLVVVQDGRGKSLTTAQERRRATGSLFYSLGPAVTGSATPSRSTALFQQPTLRGRVKSGKAVSTVAYMKLSTAESALRKAHTTKETDTKIIKHFKNRGRAEQHEIDTSPLVGTQAALPIDNDPALMRFVQAYQEQYQERLDGGVPPALPEDIRRLREVLAGHSESELTKLLEKFFASDIGYVKRHNHSLRAFLSTLNILRAIKAK